MVEAGSTHDRDVWRDCQEVCGVQAGMAYRRPQAYDGVFVEEPSADRAALFGEAGNLGISVIARPASIDRDARNKMIGPPRERCGDGCLERAAKSIRGCGRRVVRAVQFIIVVDRNQFVELVLDRFSLALIGAEEFFEGLVLTFVVVRVVAVEGVDRRAAIEKHAVEDNGRPRLVTPAQRE